MAHSPETARWYIAELTEEVPLEGDPQNIVHKKTLAMITEHEVTYLNEHHKAIRTRFWGLRELSLSNEDMDRVGILPENRFGVARRRNSTGLSPEQQFALLLSIKPGALPN